MTMNFGERVIGVVHIDGCKKNRCGPECTRITEGWEVSIHKDGVRLARLVVPKKITSESAARRWAARRHDEVLAEAAKPKEVTTTTVEAEKKPAVTFADFEPDFTNYSINNNKRSSVAAKESILRLYVLPYFGKMALDAIQPAEVEAYKTKMLKDGLDKVTINNHLTVLRKALNLAHEWGKLDKVPKIRAFKVKPKPITEKDFLTLEELPRFLAAAPSEWLAFVTVMVHTGLRVGEMLALKWMDVDLVVCRLVVRQNLWQRFEDTPKSGHERVVDLNDTALAALKRQRAVSRLKGGYVFCDADGNHLTASMVKDVVPSICAKAGLAKRLTNHGLRHTFASHLVMRGVTLKAVQELLGHSTIEMTMRYAHLSPNVKRDAVKLLDQVVGNGVGTESKSG